MSRESTGREKALNQRLRESARTGGGVLTLPELRSLGLSEKMIRNRRETGRLVPVLRGVMALPGANLTDRGRWRAAQFSCGEKSCLSHRSALALHGLVQDRGEVQVSRTSGVGGAPGSRIRTSSEFRFAVRCHQARSLPPDQVTKVAGIRVVTVERALVDFSGEASKAEIGKALSQGERERNLCWETLRNLVASTSGKKGLGKLRDELNCWSSAFVQADSVPEEDFLRLVIAHGLLVPSVNEPVGRFIADFLWRELKLVVELDPYGTHKGFESFHRDRRKSIELEQLGFRVIRITWRDLYHHPDRTIRELKEIIRQQARILAVTT